MCKGNKGGGKMLAVNLLTDKLFLKIGKETTVGDDAAFSDGIPLL